MYNQMISRLQSACMMGCEDARYTEFRHLGIDRVPVQEFRREPSYATRGLIGTPNQRPDYDLYFGVIPRDADKKPMDHAHVLWADFDDRQEFLTKALSKFLVRPNFIVDSGRGFHTYWLLSEPMPADVASTVMKGIAKMHNGDHVHDMARILRVPGSVNRKNGAIARVIRSDKAASYQWTDFIDYAEAGRDREIPRDYPRVVVYSGELPEWLIEKCNTAKPKGQRSEHAYSVVASLIELGHDLDSIQQIFEQFPDGVGEKYYEKRRNGRAWLKTTYEAALRNGVRPT